MSVSGWWRRDGASGGDGRQQPSPALALWTSSRRERPSLFQFVFHPLRYREQADVAAIVPGAAALVGDDGQVGLLALLDLDGQAILARAAPAKEQQVFLLEVDLFGD